MFVFYYSRNIAFRYPRVEKDYEKVLHILNEYEEADRIMNKLKGIDPTRGSWPGPN